MAITPYTKSLGSNNGEINQTLPEEIIYRIFSIMSPFDFTSLFLTCSYWNKKATQLSNIFPKEERVLQRCFKFAFKQVEIYDFIESQNLTEQEASQFRKECYVANISLEHCTKIICVFQNKICKGHARISSLMPDNYYHLKHSVYWNVIVNPALVKEKISLLLLASLPHDIYNSIQSSFLYDRNINLFSEEWVRKKWDVMIKITTFNLDFFLVKNQDGVVKPIRYHKVPETDKSLFKEVIVYKEGIKHINSYLEQFPEDKKLLLDKEFQENFKAMIRINCKDPEYLKQQALLQKMIPPQ